MKKSILYHKGNVRFFIKENSFVARIAACKLNTAQVAIVFGRTVYLWRIKADEFLKNEEWVKHEMIHVCQYQRYGTIRFVFLYILESVRHGYSNNRFEKEARTSETLSPDNKDSED